MPFNPDETKPVHEVIFSRKLKNIIYRNLYFSNVPVVKTISQKHLELNLDARLTFNDHINKKIGKAMKNVGLLCKLKCFLPRSSLPTIYKSLIRPHLNYGDAIYDQPSNTTFSSKIESVQYNAALAITDGIRGSSCKKFYQKLGL